MSKTNDTDTETGTLKRTSTPEGNRTVTLHNQSWVQILRLLAAEQERTGNPTLGAIANTIRSQGVDFDDG